MGKQGEDGRRLGRDGPPVSPKDSSDGNPPVDWVRDLAEHEPAGNTHPLADLRNSPAWVTSPLRRQVTMPRPEPPLEPANTTGHILGIRDDEEGSGACGRRHDRSEKLSTLDRLGTRGEATQGPGAQTKVNAPSGPGEAA